MVAFLPINALVAARTQSLQDSLMKVKDIRVGLTSEALSAIRLLKLSAWESNFQMRIESAREIELIQLRKFVLLQMASDIMWAALPLLVALSCLVTFALLNGQPPSPAQLFSSLSLFETMRFPLSMIPSVVSTVSFQFSCTVT